MKLLRCKKHGSESFAVKVALKSKIFLEFFKRACQSCQQWFCISNCNDQIQQIDRCVICLQILSGHGNGDLYGLIRTSIA